MCIVKIMGNYLIEVKKTNGYTKIDTDTIHTIYIKKLKL